jgi:hypothetical protein
MKKKLLDLLLEEDVSFRKVDPNFCNTKGFSLCGFSIMSQHVLGNSKEEVLEKMYDIKKKKLIAIKKYNSLPSMEDFFESIRQGKTLSYNRKYKVRKTGVIDHTFPYKLTDCRTGKDWLKELFYDTYFEFDPTQDVEVGNGGISFKLRRNSVQIDDSLWEKHSELVIKWKY